MAEATIATGGINPLGVVSVDAARLRAEGSPVYPQLIAPLRIALSVQAPPGARAVLRVCSTVSSLCVNDELISDQAPEVFDLLCYANNTGQELQLRFPLDHNRLEYIERTRAGDLQLAIRGKLLCEDLREWDATNPKPRVPCPGPGGPSGLFSVPFSLGLTVPRSQWATALLPKLGWSAIRVFKLPVPTAPAWAESFATSFKELEEAQRLFREGNHDQAVAHCRAAIEPFRKQVHELKTLLAESRDQKDVAAKEFSMLHSMASGTAEWLSTQLDKVYSLSSAAHHPPAIGHFSRDQAHALLLLTTSLVLYAGQALSIQERE